MVEHTAHPWTARSFDESQTVIYGPEYDGGKRELVAIVSVGRHRPNGEGNVRVIESAPLMLDALTAIVDLRFVTDELGCSCYESAPCEACQFQSAIHEGASVLAALAAAEPPQEGGHV